MAPIVAVALSGGIDSLVSAVLLKDRGYTIIGLHFLSGYEAGSPLATRHVERPVLEAIESGASRKMRTLIQQLDIPIHVIDLSKSFQTIVVDYFLDTYRSGKTPSPCLACNPQIKFDLLFKKAKALGAGAIATGHYARIVEDSDGYRHLLRGRDAIKDQSYFLARLNQKQLTTAMLPLGDMTKKQTRRIARRRGLVPVNAQESQDVCFIKEGSYSDFIHRQPGFSSRPGPIEDIHGRLIGEHSGLYRFTIGQRRGINCPAAEPYYVVRIEPQRNRLVVGHKMDLLSSSCRVVGINWIEPLPQKPFNALIQLRYRHQGALGHISPVSCDTVDITFEEPEPAVTPGQGAVFYDGDKVLGGGWIE